MKSEFLIAITQLAAEKNLPKDVVFQAMEAALASAYRKDNGGVGDVTVKIDVTSGSIRIICHKTIVEEVADPRLEMPLDEARNYKPDAEVGDVVDIPTAIQSAGRIAAQTAKQVILQRLREAEREVVYEEFSEREGEIVSGVVQRVEPKQVILDLGKAEAILPAPEQVRTEHYRPGQRLKAYLLEVSRSAKGPQLIVSRTHKNLLRRLFELEVPEIYRGVVEIKAIAREPGSRSKVAVASRQEGVDPIGSCVGMRGIRIQNIVNELGGERIDVIQWDSNPAKFVANALSPAQVLKVGTDEATNTAIVVVPDRQLSLAIGKEGQNARLAAKLTGWRIDIKSQSVAQEEVAAISVAPGEEAEAPAPAPAAVEGPAAPPEPVPIGVTAPPQGLGIRFAEELQVVAAVEGKGKKPKSSRKGEAEEPVKAKKAKKARYTEVPEEDELYEALEEL
ncbi:MAG TPA: transcription termination factor NusA [Dehalococcoidia bacterium]|nr:transcription termination factor NusA [Dehalococcoidia bacterium]